MTRWHDEEPSRIATGKRPRTRGNGQRRLDLIRATAADTGHRRLVRLTAHQPPGTDGSLTAREPASDNSRLARLTVRREQALGTDSWRK